MLSKKLNELISSSHFITEVKQHFGSLVELGWETALATPSDDGMGLDMVAAKRRKDRIESQSSSGGRIVQLPISYKTPNHTATTRGSKEIQ